MKPLVGAALPIDCPAEGRGTRYTAPLAGSGYRTYEIGDHGAVRYTPRLTLDARRQDFPRGFPPIS